MLEDVHAMVQPLAAFDQVHQLNLRPLPAGHAATKGCRQQRTDAAAATGKLPEAVAPVAPGERTLAGQDGVTKASLSDDPM
jgi:hypothetical protein